MRTELQRHWILPFRILMVWSSLRRVEAKLIHHLRALSLSLAYMARIPNYMPAFHRKLLKPIMVVICWLGDE